MRIDRMNALAGVDAADSAADDEQAAEVDGAALGEKFRDPAYQDRVLHPEELSLPTEVFVVDWACERGHVTTTSGANPGGCSSPHCKAAIVREPVERLREDRYVLQLAFTAHDIRRRKVYERIEHLAMIVLAELRRFPAQDFRYLDAALTAPATRQIVRETLAYLAECPLDLVDGISQTDLTAAAWRLITLHNEHVASLSKKAEATERAPLGSDRFTPSSARTGTPPTNSIAS